MLICNKRTAFLISPFTAFINLVRPILLLKLYLNAFAPYTGLMLPPNLCFITYKAFLSLISLTIYSEADPCLDNRKLPSPSITPANHSLKSLSFDSLEYTLEQLLLFLRIAGAPLYKG